MRKIVLFSIALFLFSCFGNKKDIVHTDSEISTDKKTDTLSFDTKGETETEILTVQNASISMEEIRKRIRSSTFVTEKEKEDIKALIYENDEYVKQNKLEITYISEANFGITGGDNWIVRFSDGVIVIFVINNNMIVKNYSTTTFNLAEYSAFDIMRDIPGIRIDNSTSVFGDFNGDGVDEIFIYGFYGAGKFIVIYSYDKENDDFFNLYCRIPFEIIDFNHGPAPVEFINYNGIDGFKVCIFEPEVAGGPGWTPSPSPRNNKWFFYTWDAEQRQYVEVGEVID